MKDRIKEHDRDIRLRMLNNVEHISYYIHILLVIVLTRAAPALQYHFLFFFLSWACCLQLCNFSVMLLRNCGSVLWC